MKGCRCLLESEVNAMDTYFSERKDKLAVRDRTLFFFGLYSGFRISELLSIKTKDIFAYNQITDSVYLKRQNTKKKVAGRTGYINDSCKLLLENYLKEYTDIKDNLESYLFPSSKKPGNPLSVRMCEYILFKGFKECKMTGKLSCHSLRKTFAQKMYNLLDRNILDVQQCLGHSSVSSTQQYLKFDNKKVNDALRKLKF